MQDEKTFPGCHGCSWERQLFHLLREENNSGFLFYRFYKFGYVTPTISKSILFFTSAQDFKGTTILCLSSRVVRFFLFENLFETSLFPSSSKHIAVSSFEVNLAHTLQPARHKCKRSVSITPVRYISISISLKNEKKCRRIALLRFCTMEGVIETQLLRVQRRKQKPKTKEKSFCPALPENKPSAETSEGNAGITSPWWPLILLQVG